VPELRALTVKQPWAGCIAHLDKRTENRSWRLPDKYRGVQAAIHAGASVDRDNISAPMGAEGWASLFASSAEWDAWRFWDLGRKPRDEASWPPRLSLGAVVAVATLAACHRFDFDEFCGHKGDWSETSRHPGICSPYALIRLGWHWELADVRPLAEPVPCKGKLGLWRLPDDVEKAVREQLEADND